MADKTLWNMEDIKALRKNDTDMTTHLIGHGFVLAFKYPSIKKMNAEFSKFEKHWQAIRNARKKYETQHRKEREKIMKTQVNFMKAAKKHYATHD